VPGQRLEAREVAIEGDQFPGVLEGDGRQLGSGDQVARRLGGLTELLQQDLTASTRKAGGMGARC